MTTESTTPPADGGADQPAPPPGDLLPPKGPAHTPDEATEAYGRMAAATGSADSAADAVADAVADAEHTLPLGHDATRDELLQRLEQTEIAVTLLEAERDEYKADLQRKAAELSNVLKREQRNAGVGRVDGRIDVMRVLLDVLDDFDRTMDAVNGLEDEGVRAGIALVHDKFAAALAGQGLVRVGEPGEAFDPNRHEAVQQVDAEDGPLDEPVIDQVFRPGYLVGDRVVRAAMVVVRQ